MKRKFSFNLAPVKTPSKSELQGKQSSEPLPSSSHSHRRHYSKDSISSLHSPYISRRPLSPKTEQELRAACALILQNFKPSDHDMVDANPKLDFHGPNRRREHNNATSQVKVRKPTGAPAEPRNTHDARNQSHRPDAPAKTYPDLPMRANTGRRRAENTEAANKEADIRKNAKSPAQEIPKHVAVRTEKDSDDGKSVGTPLTDSTETHLNNGSTAPTSAALTSGRSSKRVSHQFESAAAVADAQAAEWMRQELEKRRQQQASQPLPPPEPQAPARPPSRARSIKADIKGYIFPRSNSLSRTQSRESMNTMNSQNSSQPKRSDSSHGWRSWGLQRKSSSRSSSRPGTSKGRIESHEQDKKQSINLNRELPPLPSLDSWKQSQNPKKENRKSQSNGAHIATVMRPQDQQQQDYAAAVRRHHRRSGSDTLALRYANAHPHPPAQVIRTAAHGKTVTRRGPSIDAAMDFDHMMSAMSSTRNLDEQLKLGSNGHAPQHSMSSDSRSPSMKFSNEGRLEAPPNFSRKISTEVPPHRTYHDGLAYQNVVQIASPRGDEQKSKLKRVLSGWMLRKERKDDWMQRIEREGVKGGVMIQDEAALPPVVRY